MVDDVFSMLREPFVVLSGTPVSALSILTALLIIIAARVITGFIARSLGHMLTKRGAGDGVGFAVGKITRWGGTITGVFIALTTIGVNMNAALAAMTVLLVGIGFGLQKMAENFISGLILLVERPLKIGDFISVDGKVGTVTDIGLRATCLMTNDGYVMVIPNADLITKPVTNFSAPTDSLRVWIRIGVAYGTDLAIARETLLEIAKQDPDILSEPPVQVMHTGFGDSSIDLALVGWITNAPDEAAVASRLRFAIDAAFRVKEIEIPFPQREVRIKNPPASPQP